MDIFSKRRPVQQGLFGGPEKAPPMEQRSMQLGTMAKPLSFKDAVGEWCRRNKAGFMGFTEVQTLLGEWEPAAKLSLRDGRIVVRSETEIREDLPA